jgi:CheY-like chemotaxis protein
MARILIINDNPDQVQLNRILLESAQHEVIVGENGTSGLNLARSEKPDLILLDIHMPDINGFDVFHELQGSPDTKFIPVIFQTATYDELDGKVKGLSMGATDYITMPAGKDLIILTISRALAHVAFQQDILSRARSFVGKGDLLHAAREAETILQAYPCENVFAQEGAAFILECARNLHGLDRDDEARTALQILTKYPRFEESRNAGAILRESGPGKLIFPTP